ncbi:acetyltransferase complex ard1 subunit, putative [Entamoeba invadens IP1]|uniref:acetyltransferase complex ard1 subunit, putative n=1 Tax=Entamoeba invadens IP1 TaxID=370355 RepID=UPI0002C3FB5E|nr:acetyltransferase complex ard1 subunit, putative [Entamoeba invadens IP1]ELP93071.1 acetyltransferase complex ard1 subunit, putative [Entamoeba invadens IP1]|eukprot:XP_004259842.1 acetyltransferase complex ard1 subunit, putative [Entamoeba invadens IP1]
MINVRPVTSVDLLSLQNYTLTSFEGYPLQYYYFHYLSWPYIMYVAEDDKKSIVGHIILKCEDGISLKNVISVTSLNVQLSSRNCGIGSLLLRMAINAAIEVYGARYCMLRINFEDNFLVHFLVNKNGFERVGEDFTFIKKLKLEDQIESDCTALCAVQWRKSVIRDEK